MARAAVCFVKIILFLKQELPVFQGKPPVGGDYALPTSSPSRHRRFKTTRRAGS